VIVGIDVGCSSSACSVLKFIEGCFDDDGERFFSITVCGGGTAVV
jgi:hypothetical protein